MDRRVQASQQKFVDALRVLMQRYPWETITIATICQESGLSRSTFYSHFSSKEELMQLSLEYLARELAPTDTRRGLDTTCTLKFVPALLDHVKHHREILEQNRDTAAAAINLQNLRKTIHGLVFSELDNSSFASSTNRANCIFTSGGLMAIIEQWNDEKCIEPVQSVVEVIDKQIRSVFNSFRENTA